MEVVMEVAMEVDNTVDMVSEVVMMEEVATYLDKEVSWISLEEPVIVEQQERNEEFVVA